MVSQIPLESAQDAAIHLEMSQAFNTGFTLKDFDRETHILDKDMEKQSLSNIPVLLEYDPSTPLVLSPTSSVSIPSSPNIGSFWDTPETPACQSSSQGDYSPLTPLTPPVTSDDLEQAFKPQVKSPFFSNNVAPRDPYSVNADPQFAQTTPVLQEAVSKKLFHEIEDIISASKKNWQ